MTKIYVPSITHGSTELKKPQAFDISDWNSDGKKSTLDDAWFEAEGFVINREGKPVVWGKSWFQEIPEKDEKILEVSRYPNWEDDINRILSENTRWLFRDKIVKVTQELYLPSIEISFNQWYSPTEMIRKVLLSFQELADSLEKYHVSFLPLGNLPVETPNVPNFANHYYEYLFNIRDGFDIVEFRGAALQLHKGIEDKHLAIYTFNKIRHLLPFFLALTGNSPFYNGRYRGNISERTSTKSSWKMVWIPDAIDDTFYKQLQEWLNVTIKSVTPYYYAVRYPRVDIRTIENCSMDMVHDVRVMIACFDLYYRITEKIREHYFSQEPLPESLFGNDSGCMVETNVIRENFHRAIRHWTKTQFARVKWPCNGQDIKSISEALLKWIQDTPTTVPTEVQKRLWICNNTDFTMYMLSDIIQNGNLWERTITQFGLQNDTIINPIHIPTKYLQEFMKTSADSFRAQVNDILSD